MNKCNNTESVNYQYVSRDCANLNAFIKKITQSFCTNSNFAIVRKSKKTNQGRMKIWSL